MIWSDFEFVIPLACIIKTRILDIIWPCLLIIMIMTWRFSGILFICALVVSFAARARRARAANDTTRAQINNIPSKSHVIPLLTQHNTFWININKTILTFTRQYRTTPDTMVASYFRWSSKIKSTVLKFANNSYITPMSKIVTNQPSILWYYWALAPFWEEANCT